MVENKNVGLITVRTSSSRLPNKCLLPFGDCSVIVHVAKRAINFGIRPIICTSIDPSDDVLENIAKDLGIECFRGSLVNKIDRWFECAKQFNIKTFHSIDADDPFFDGTEMIRSLELLRSSDCDVVCPTKSSSSGGASVGYSLTIDILDRALCGLDKNTDTEMMWYYLEKVDGIKMLTLPDIHQDAPVVRLTLDYEEDYWLLASLVRILGNDASRSDINELFLNNPNLAEINLFRNEAWKAAQLSKIL